MKERGLREVRQRPFTDGSTQSLLKMPLDMTVETVEPAHELF